jgi:putative endonuclease
MAFDKRFVYVLRNGSMPARYYTGVTTNVTARLAAHNAGHCTHTTAGRPRAIDLVVEFTDETRALTFEEPKLRRARQTRSANASRIEVLSG